MTDRTPYPAQDPGATAVMPRIGPAVPSGSRVVLRVSSGAPPTPPVAYVSVPDVAGAAQGDALTTLQSIGLPAEVFDDFSGAVARGHVISQLPAPGQNVPANSKVVVLVSRGAAANPTAQVGLPLVDGLPEADAVNALRGSGLDAQVVREYSGKVVAGTVIDQLPNASSLTMAPVAKRSLLWLWIALAIVVIGVLGFFAFAALNKTGLVPNVTGMTQADAQAAITAAGFKVGAIGTTQTVSSADVGKVVAQSPAAGTAAKPRSAVDIVVSGGQKLVAVPAVTGMTQAEAQTTLTNAGLTSTITNGNSSTVPKGSVISQAPSAGQQVPSGTSVGITVSQGKANATVPNVVGQSQSDAQNTLKAKGLSSAVVSNYNSAPSGQVYSQTPAAGTVVAPGTVVSIQVSKGPAPAPTTVTVPNVIGQTQPNATNKLTGLGFQVKVSSIATGTAGNVYAQTPAANSQAQKGSTVSIVVSHP